MNEWREGQHLSILQEESLLRDTAKLYAAELLKRGMLSHIDSHGHRALWRYRDQGGTATSVGEVLGTHDSSLPVKSIFPLWLNSPEHRRVLGENEWSCFGIGIAENEIARVVVLLFSNSLLVKSKSRECLHIIQGPVGLRFPLEQLQLNYNVTCLNPEDWRSNVPRLLELWDLEGNKRNRLIILPDEDHEDAE